MRASSAKALGALFADVGEDEGEVEEMIAWLMATLCMESSLVERSGAAQCLSEICLAMQDVGKVKQILRETLPLQKNPKSAARGNKEENSTFSVLESNDGILFCLPRSIVVVVFLAGCSQQ